MSRFDDGSDERVNPADARRVVEMWMAQGGTAGQDWPSVADLAEALRTTPDEIRIMLARARSSEMPIGPAPVRRPLFSAKSWHIGLGIVGIGCLLLGLIAIGLGFLAPVSTEVRMGTAASAPPEMEAVKAQDMATSRAGVNPGVRIEGGATVGR